MPKLVWRNLIGQEKVKTVLAAAFENESLGHAYLFAGDAGTGKFQAALEIAMALLCANRDSAPCYSCDSCRKILHHAHPDLRIIFPLMLQSEHKTSDGKLSEKGWQHCAESAAARIAKPYAIIDNEGIPSIPVEWIRETNNAIQRGTIEGKKCIAIIDDVDSMNKESANAMLKILEEPPADTLFILLTRKSHAVLPTILSRCQLIRFGCVPPEQIDATLTIWFPQVGADQRKQTVRFCMGSPGRAAWLIEHPAGEADAVAETLWSLAARGDWPALFPTFDALASGNDYSACERLFLSFMHRIRSDVLGKAGLTENYFTENESRAPLGPGQAEELYGICQHALNSLSARGNVPLIFANFLFSLVEILHGKKQQAH